MKTIFTLIAFFATTSIYACGSIVPTQSFPTVSLSQFGMNSWTVAKTPTLTPYKYDFTICSTINKRIGTQVPNQHFPTVKLSEFNMNSWTVAK